MQIWTLDGIGSVQKVVWESLRTVLQLIGNRSVGKPFFASGNVSWQNVHVTIAYSKIWNQLNSWKQCPMRRKINIQFTCSCEMMRESGFQTQKVNNVEIPVWEWISLWDKSISICYMGCNRYFLSHNNKYIFQYENIFPVSRWSEIQNYWIHQIQGSGE